VSLICKHCGNQFLQGRAGSQPTDRVLDAAMGTYTRLRKCACGAKEKTVEMRHSELADLRRRAFLYELSEAKT
jgi:hypothetical protein